MNDNSNFFVQAEASEKSMPFDGTYITLPEVKPDPQLGDWIAQLKANMVFACGVPPECIRGRRLKEYVATVVSLNKALKSALSAMVQKQPYKVILGQAYIMMRHCYWLLPEGKEALKTSTLKQALIFASICNRPMQVKKLKKLEKEL